MNHRHGSSMQAALRLCSMKPNLDRKPNSGTNCLGSRFVGHLPPQQSVSLRWPLMRLVCLLVPLLYYCPIRVSVPVTCSTSPRHHDIDTTLARCFFVLIESSMKAQTCHDPADVLLDLIADLYPLSASGLRMEGNALVLKALLPRA
jgi:hypothetical protein